MLWDLVNFQKIKRALLYALYMSLVLLVQDALFSNISIFGVRAMFVPAAAVAVGMFEGGVWGAALGLVTGYLTDISYGNVALFTVLFPLLGFFSGVFTRWFVNASLFAYLIMCLVAFAVTAAAQMLELLLTGNALLPMLRTAIIQTLWSMPMAAALYFPCRAIGRKKI